MKIALILLSLVMGLSSSHAIILVGRFKVPDGPHLQKTPGELCSTPNEYRYKERIPYCSRDVSSQLKKDIIAMYDAELGYEIRRLPRHDFKIDHFIPLSIGGSNSVKNLWPQHKKVYEHSDKIESYVAELIRRGKITQSEAIEAVKTCKLDLATCDDIEDELETMM